MNRTYPQSERLQQLPPYIFSEINAIKSEAVRQGKSLLSLGIGDPDKPTPTEIIAKIQECAGNTKNHVYSPYEGTAEFRHAAAAWLNQRFGVAVDADKEVVAVIGTKEAIAHFPIAFLNPGDRALYPSPGYPVFSTSISLNGGIPIPMPLRAEQGFLPDPDELKRLIEVNQPRYMILNFPSNPTSAFCTRDRLEAIVALAQKHGIVVLQDNAYSEIYFDDAKKPISILEIPGAMEVAVELHSFSKSYNMTGWRIGFAAGNASLCAGLLRAKTNIDSGPLLAVQSACPFILQNSHRFSEPIRQLYKQRRDTLCRELDSMGVEYLPAQGTMFVWARVPGGTSSMEMCKRLIQEQGLVVTPGVGFGAEGEGFFRMALTVDTPEIKRSADLLGKYLGR
jgi:LL-diaminopimelate aminotransferase